MTLDRPIFTGLNAAAFCEFRSEEFSATTRAPQGRASNAHIHAAGGGATYQLLENGVLGLQISYALTGTLIGIGSTNGLVFRLNYAHTFTLPPELGVGPLITTPIVYRIYSRETKADPEIVPSVLASSQEWRYGLDAKLGLNNNAAVGLQVLREVTKSNIVGHTQNTQATASLLFAF